MLLFKFTCFAFILFVVILVVRKHLVVTTVHPYYYDYESVVREVGTTNLSYWQTKIGRKTIKNNEYIKDED
jgi:G:T-mismatch repair DNA endonuclease (very short patch repair protein)